MIKLKEFLSYSINITEDIHMDVKTMLFVILVFFLTSLFLKLLKKIVNRKLDEENKGKFKAVFSFTKYFVYSIVLIVALESSGIKLSVLLGRICCIISGDWIGVANLISRHHVLVFLFWLINHYM
jgi:hypothetical protein